MSDLESNKTTKSQNLLNIVKGLKRRKMEKKSILPTLIESVEPTVESTKTKEDLSIGINDKTNYAPPGYLVWNYYYDTPLQKIPNDTPILIKSNSSTYTIVGFHNDTYRVIIEGEVVSIHSDDFRLVDESKREYYNMIYKKNMEYHDLHPPTKDLSTLDLLTYTKIDPKPLTIDTKSVISNVKEVEEVDSRYSVILSVKRSVSNYKMGFKFRVWNLYVSSEDRKHLLFYDNLLIEKGIDDLYEDGYIRFLWAYSNSEPSLVPSEQILPSIDNLPHFRESVEFLKQTKPLAFKQSGGNSVNGFIKTVNYKQENDEVPELIVNKYRIKNGELEEYSSDITESYQPYPPRKSHAASELKIITEDRNVKKKYKDILGTYEFVNLENYFGFIYKHKKYIIIKKGFDKPIEKLDNTEYSTLEIQEDHFGECDDTTQCYWFIARELEPDEYKTVQEPDDIVSRISNNIGNFISNIKDRISQSSYESINHDEVNEGIINRYFSDDESSDESEQKTRYKPILYALAKHQTNSIPLEHEWYSMDSINLDKPVYVPIEVREKITDSDRIIQFFNNNRFLVLPWELDEITDYNRDERFVVKRDEEKGILQENTPVRIIKDFGYSGFNIRYFTGTITSVKKTGGKYMYTIELDFPFITDEDIVVDSSFIEVITPMNNLNVYFNAINNLRDELMNIPACRNTVYKSLLQKRYNNNKLDADALILHSSLYEVLKYYLDKMVMNPNSVIQFNFTQVSDNKIHFNVDFPSETLQIDPFYKPTIKPHIFDHLISICEKICSDERLENIYNCTIEDNWPPSIGDTVVILEGEQKGKKAIIMDIKTGLNISTNGEAVLKIEGMRSPYHITMNYLVNDIETDLKPIMYDGFLRLNITLVPTHKHSKVEIVEYSNPDNKFRKNHIVSGDYVSIKDGKYAGKIAQVLDVDVDELILPDYYVAERAGYPMIMKNSNTRPLRNGLQYRIKAKTADLYDLTDKHERKKKYTLVYSPYNKDVSQCEIVNRNDAIKIIEHMSKHRNKKNTPLDRLKLLVGKHK